MARAHDAIGGRWTILIVRELLMGSRRFNDIRRGIPRISRTMLAARLRDLSRLGVVQRGGDGSALDYTLTAAGQELAELIGALGSWGQRWLKRAAAREDIDLDPLLIDMRRRARLDRLPTTPQVLRFEFAHGAPRFLLLKRGEADFCAQNPGFPETLQISGKHAALVGWWRGDIEFAAARRQGLNLAGSAAAIKAFPTWFDRYLFAGIRSARSDAGENHDLTHRPSRHAPLAR